MRLAISAWVMQFRSNMARISLAFL